MKNNDSPHELIAFNATVFENHEKLETLPHSFSRVKTVAATKKTIEIATQKCCKKYIGNSLTFNFIYPIFNRFKHQPKQAF